MSLKNFTKEKLESTRAIQKSEWDELYPEFTEGGHVLYWDEKDVTRTKAANGAKRLNLLAENKSEDKVFHSGFNTLKQKSFIRLRPKEEVEELKKLGKKGDDTDESDKEAEASAQVEEYLQRDSQNTEVEKKRPSIFDLDDE